MFGVGAASSFMAGTLTDNDDKDKDREQRIKNIKDLLTDLIDQAKTDAEYYYEKNLRHENAIDTAYSISTKSVNDAIIAPNGNVITTAPDNYLIATKTPGSLVGNQGTVINFNLVDKSTGGSVQVQKTTQKQNPDGSIDIEAVVTAIMNKNIAEGKSDEAFAAMNSRIQGISYSM